MAGSIELVALSLSLDTTKFRKDIEYTQRMLGQTKGAFRDLTEVTRILDKAQADQVITEQQATAAKNKAIATVERHQATLRREAETVKALNLAKQQAAAIDQARSRDTLGLSGFSGSTGAAALGVSPSSQTSLSMYSGTLEKVRADTLGLVADTNRLGNEVKGAFGPSTTASLGAYSGSIAKAKTDTIGLTIETNKLGREIASTLATARAPSAATSFSLDSYANVNKATEQARRNTLGLTQETVKLSKELDSVVSSSSQSSLNAYLNSTQAVTNATAQAKEEAIKAQAAFAGWNNGLRQTALTQHAQALDRARAGANAWVAGLQNMSSASSAQAAAVRAAQAAVEGWDNGLRRIDLTPLARDLEQSRAGAIAWAQGLDQAAAAANRAASAAGQLRREAREAARRSRLAVLDEVGLTERPAPSRNDPPLLDQTANYREGFQFLQQFETAQQRVSRQLIEASNLYRRGAILQDEYAFAARRIRQQNSLLHQSFGQLKGVMLTLFGPLTAVIAAYEGLKVSIKLSAELDAARARFKIFTGSVSGANRVLVQLRELSSTSPVSFAGAQRATTTMLQFGVAADEVIPSLKQIAEITGGNTERMESLSLAFGQSASAGRLMGQELLQMVNAGFSPLRIISDQTGESMADLKKRMEEGGISFQAVQNAFRDATREGGRFNGLLQEVADTTAGKMTRAQSELEKFGTAFGDFLRPVTDGSLDNFIQSMKTLQQTLELINSIQGDPDSLITKIFDFALSSPALNALSFPQYVADYKTSLSELEGADAKYSKAAFQRAEAIKRLNDSRYGGLVTDGTAKQAEDLIKQYRRLQSLAESVKDDPAFVIPEKDRTELKRFMNYQAVVRRQAKNVTEEEYETIRKRFEEEKAGLKTVEERNKAQIEFLDLVGEGFFTDEQLRQAAKVRAELKEAARQAAELKRVTDTFADSLKKASETRIDNIYGERADSVKLLVAQSVDGERKVLDGLVKQGAAYDAILAAANPQAQAELAKLEAIQQQNALYKQQEDIKNKRTEQDEAFFKELANLESQALYLKEIVSLGKEQARINQLRRDENLPQVQAELQQAAEAKLAAEEKIADVLKEQAEALERQTEEKKKQQEQFFDDLAQIESQALYLKEVAKLGERPARVEQLRRDEKLSLDNAKLKEEAEERLKLEEKIAELRKTAKELKNGSAFDKLVEGMSELQQLAQLGFISQQIADAQTKKLVDEATPKEQTNAGAPRAIQAGSVEAFALQANAQVKLISEQIRIANRAFVAQKATAEATKQTAKVLDNIKDNLGALPTP